MKLDNVRKDKSVARDEHFTRDQEAAVEGIIDFIAAPFNPASYIVGLSGPAGTGKTFVTKYIIAHCRYNNSVIKCASPTHKACRVFSQAIGGREVDTIQSVFGFRLDLRLEDFDPVNPQFNPMSAPKLESTRVLIIDEASMLPAKLVTYICTTCKENDIKVIFIGDPCQLAPVNEKKSIAFERCFKVYRLNEVVRQAKTNPVNDLLALLRHDIEHGTCRFMEYATTHVGGMVYNDVGEGFSICSPANFKRVIDTSFTDEGYTKNIDMYRIVSYTNNCVSGWNNYIRNSIIKDSDRNIITKNDLIMSYETIVNEFNDTIIKNSEEYIINDIVNYVDDNYDFKGFLVKFQMIHGGSITPPLFIIDHKDKFTIMKYHKTITELIDTAKNASGGTRVAHWKEYYRFKKKYLIATNIMSKSGKLLHERDIDYGFAITAHKSQGSTYDVVFVDVNDMVYDKFGHPYADYNDLLRRLYVGCSRARRELVVCCGK